MMRKLQTALRIPQASLPAAQNRAIYLPGTIYLQTFGLNLPYPSSEGVVASFWYASAGTGQQTFLSSFNNSGPQPIVLFTKVNYGTARRPDMRLSFFFANSGDMLAPFQTYVSVFSLPIDSAPHHVSVAVNTSTKQALHNVDGIPYGWDAAKSGSNGAGFQVIYEDAFAHPNEWLIGAQLNLRGNPTAYLGGDLGELYYFNGPQGYAFASTVGGLQGAFAQQKLAMDGTRIAFGPVELGPAGTGVMPPGQVPPIICCRGGYPEFLNNQLGTTSFISVGGTPTTSTNGQDPWQLWP